MILTAAQVKMIAERGRALPDDVLAPLVLDAVLGASAQKQAPPVDEPDTQKPPPRTYGTLDGHVDQLVAFLTVRPGSPMRKIMVHLGLSRARAGEVVTQAMEYGRVERRGVYNSTKYHVATPKPVDPKPSCLLTEQVVNGEHKQRLVHVERRKIVRHATQ